MGAWRAVVGKDNAAARWTQRFAAAVGVTRAGRVVVGRGKTNAEDAEENAKDAKED
jgi:hypothetical protein